MLYPHTPDQGGEVTTRSRNVKQDIPEIGEERPFVAFVVRVVRDTQPKRSLLSTVNLNGIVLAGFLLLEQLLKFINDSLTLVMGNPDFSEIHFNYGVSVSLVVHGQTLLRLSLLSIPQTDISLFIQLIRRTVYFRLQIYFNETKILNKLRRFTIGEAKS